MGLNFIWLSFRNPLICNQISPQRCSWLNLLQSRLRKPKTKDQRLIMGIPALLRGANLQMWFLFLSRWTKWQFLLPQATSTLPWTWWRWLPRRRPSWPRSRTRSATSSAGSARRSTTTPSVSPSIGEHWEHISIFCVFCHRRSIGPLSSCLSHCTVLHYSATKALPTTKGMNACNAGSPRDIFSSFPWGKGFLGKRPFSLLRVIERNCFLTTSPHIT